MGHSIERGDQPAAVRAGDEASHLFARRLLTQELEEELLLQRSQVEAPRRLVDHREIGLAGVHRPAFADPAYRVSEMLTRGFEIVRHVRRA